MEIITRKQAVQLNLKKYFTGDPCKRGHISERYVLGGCSKCMSIDSKEWDIKNSSKRLKYVRQWRKKNPEQTKILRNNWKRSNSKNRKMNDRIRTIREKNATPKWLNKSDYHLDHIVPLCGKTPDCPRDWEYNVSGLEVPWNKKFISSKQNLIKKNQMSQLDYKIACSLLM